MARILLTGGKSENISQKRAEKILEWKSDENVDQSRMVDIGRDYFIELRQIKGVTMDNAVEEGNGEDLKRKERHEELLEINAQREKLKTASPDHKAKQTLRTFCWLLWIARGNPVDTQDTFLKDHKELETELMIRLIAYFEENKQEWNAPREVYQDLIALKGSKIKSNVKGFKSIGELMTG